MLQNYFWCLHRCTIHSDCYRHICKLAVDVRKLVSFEKFIVEVWLVSQHVEKSLHLVHKHKSMVRVEISSDLLTIKCLVYANYQILYCHRNLSEHYHIGTCRKEEGFKARPRGTMLHDWTGMSKYVGVLARCHIKWCSGTGLRYI
jgi:hypothetical protein